MNEMYHNRFGNLPPNQALYRVVRSLELEALALNLSRGVESQTVLHDDRRSAVDRYREPNSIVRSIHTQLGSRVGVSPLSTSATPEIIKALEAITQETGKDYTWMAAIIGKSPQDYIRVHGDKLMPEQRQLLLELLREGK